MPCRESKEGGLVSRLEEEQINSSDQCWGVLRTVLKPAHTFRAFAATLENPRSNGGGRARGWVFSRGGSPTTSPVTIFEDDEARAFFFFVALSNRA